MARDQVHGTIAFYHKLLTKNTSKTWLELLALATSFGPIIGEALPHILAELQGVADGAGVPIAEILAINVRTELNFGCYSDGCTSLAWYDGQTSVLAQNWDWMAAQRENLINLDLQPTEGARPRIKIITEAGIIGKIGFNEDGVGVCLNAIKAKGMDASRLPCHVALRAVLESRSRNDAVAMLEKWGVASACHMLVADSTGGVGLEWTGETGRRLDMDDKGRVFHTNHYLHQDLKGKDPKWLEDSPHRLQRVACLCDELGEPSLEPVQDLFSDEKNYPTAICRNEQDGAQIETLFNITMDLTAKTARVLVGRPVHPAESISLDFQ